jgi:hypothetical protein
MTFDPTAAAAILKQTYPDGIVPIDYARAKTLALLKKSKGTVVSGPFGAGFVQPLKYGNPQAGSATYATGYAQASTESSRYQQWFLTPGELFQFARVNGKLTRISEGTGSFVNAMVSEIENARNALTRMVEIFLGGNGWGCLGQIDQTAASVSTTTLTLAQPWMARMFEIGMSLVAASSDHASALRSATSIKITKVDASAGTLTMASAGNSQSWAVGDYLFRDGDRDNAYTTKLVPCGFNAFLPQTAPTSGQTLFTVDQSLSVRTGGNRRDASAGGGNIEEVLLDLSADIDAQGGVTTHCVLGTKAHAKLVKSMLNKTYFDVEDIDGAPLGFRGVLLAGASGDMLCYSDGAFPEGVAWQFSIDDVGIIHTGKDLIMLEEKDGLQFREVAGSDDWMARLISSYQFYDDAPGHGGVAYNL